MEYIPFGYYPPLNICREDCDSIDEYCIRKVYLIKKEEGSYGNVWTDDYRDPIIKCYLINDENDNHVLISPKHFKFTVYERTHFLYDIESTLEQLCKIKVPRDERYKVLSNSAFDIVDTNDVKRTFIYSIKKLDNDELYGMTVSEFLQCSKGYKIKPLQYVLTMTCDNGLNQVKSFMKCLKLNDIEIKKGKFNNQDLINAK